MNNTIKFKIHGIDRLLTYEQLAALESRGPLPRVRVIDTRTQRNWETNFKTVLDKFR